MLSDQARAAIAIYDAVHRLSSEQRDALTQTYIRRRTVNEAAIFLGVPAHVVKTRTHEAVRSLNASSGHSREAAHGEAPRPNSARGRSWSARLETWYIALCIIIAPVLLALYLLLWPLVR